MTKRTHFKPTESELEILQVLWEMGPSSVRSVNQKLNEKRDVGYTTTLKLMQIMVDKGLAERDTSQRTHIYRATIAEGDIQQRLLKNFVDTAFRGSAMKLVVQALGNHEATEDELREIKDLIAKLEDSRNQDPTKS